MKKYLWTIVWILLVNSCDSDGQKVDSVVLLRELDEVMDSLPMDSSVRSMIFRIRIPRENVTWSYARGIAFGNTAAVPEDQFMSASIGKMMTALLIVKLQEAGLLQFDDSIALYLPGDILTGLHVFEGREYSRDITIRQLLRHTSGLDDVFGGGSPDSNGLTPLMQELLAEPNRVWSPRDVIDFYKAHFHAQSVPGAVHRYSDTGYQLLGLVAESAGGQPFHVALWQRVLQPLGMSHTFVIGYDAPRGTASGRMPSEAFFGDIPLTFPAVAFDWAGGGLYTTTEDLEKALDAVRSGTFLSDASRAEMLNWIPDGEGGGYGFGVSRFVFGYWPDAYVIGHGGATNSIAFYSVRHDAYIIGTLNQIQPQRIDIGELILDVLEILEGALK